VKLALFRNRGFATSTFIRTIQLAASQVRAQYPTGERVQLGDIAAKSGGYVSGHASHQNGLDGDFAYFTVKGVELDPGSTASDTFPELFVKSGRITSNFHVAKNWAILRNIVARGNVNRIFVDPVVKSTLCKGASVVDPGLSLAARTEVLRRLNPYTNHADHFHVRLKCPANHPKCTDQSDPPAGSGCSRVSASNEGEVETFEAMTPQQIEDENLGEDEG
jgi:penicillin-insensitive murein endopeptidase